jgi:hypothetical protein
MGISLNDLFFGSAREDASSSDGDSGTTELRDSYG